MVRSICILVRFSCSHLCEHRLTFKKLLPQPNLARIHLVVQRRKVTNGKSRSPDRTARVNSKRSDVKVCRATLRR